MSRSSLQRARAQGRKRTPRVRIVCDGPECPNTFERLSSQVRPRNFCSRQCFSGSRKMVSLTCSLVTCRTQFERPANQHRPGAQPYCTTECRIAAAKLSATERARHLICENPACARAFTRAASYAAKGSFCSVACSALVVGARRLKPDRADHRLRLAGLGMLERAHPSWSVARPRYQEWAGAWQALRVLEKICKEED